MRTKHIDETDLGPCIAETQNCYIHVGTTINKRDGYNGSCDGDDCNDGVDDDVDRDNGGEEEKQLTILKVAKTFEDNDVLAEEAGEFALLSAFNERVAEFAKDRGLDDFHYDWLFAKLLSSRTESALAERRVNTFTVLNAVDGLVPLSKLRARIEISPHSSVWILRLFFKFYSFFELSAIDDRSVAVHYPLFSPDDYLIAPEKKRLVYYHFAGDALDAVANDFVKAVADFVLDWIVVGDDSAERRYAALLEDFAKVGRVSFEKAYDDFYMTTEELWPNGDEAFVYRERNAVKWETWKVQEEGGKK